MSIESTVIILLFTAIFLPLAREVGIDPVHFGPVFVLVCTMGLVTPPVAVAMYTVCSIMDCSIKEYISEFMPFSVPILLVEILIIFFQGVVLFLHNLVSGKG